MYANARRAAWGADDAGANADGKVPVVVSIYLARRRLVVHRGGEALEWLPPAACAKDKRLLGTGGRVLGPQHQAGEGNHRRHP